MKWTFANVGILIFGLFGIIIITFFNDITVSNEQDYYTLKEAVEASMTEAVDVTYYRLTGSIKINQEKFVENFTRRFAQVSTFGDGNYNIEFYDISESPPKVSVRIKDATNTYNIFGTFGVDPSKAFVVNEISAIIDVYEDGIGTVISSKNLSAVNVALGKLKVYEYNNKYYQVTDNSRTLDTNGSCTIIENGIECLDSGGNKMILNEITKEQAEEVSMTWETEEVNSTCISPENGIDGENVDYDQALGYANGQCKEIYKDMYDECSVDRIQRGDYNNWLIYYQCSKRIY